MYANPKTTVRAGEFADIIEVLAQSDTRDRFNAKVQTWSVVERLRAQYTVPNVYRRVSEYGEFSISRVIFRTRKTVASTNHRVRYRGVDFEVLEVHVIGPRGGRYYEIVCEKAK